MTRTFEVELYGSAADFEAGQRDDVLVNLPSQERAARTAAYALCGINEFRRTRCVVARARAADGSWETVLRRDLGRPADGLE